MTTSRFPLAETAADLASGSRDPEATVDRCCDRIDAADAKVRAFLPEPERRERLHREAGELAGRFPDPADRPPLFGVPVGVKDIFHVDGFSTRAGSDLPPEALAGPEGPAVGRLREAGALVLGKTVTTEFAYFEPGPTRNPHDPGHTPGGSSSGSAAAVAAGMCPLALGTQTAGSVLRPAAFCGVVGFKPTYGRIPTEGVIPLAESLDHVGLFAQDVAGARLAASVLCDGWDEDAATGTAGAVAGAADDVAGPDTGEHPTLGVPADAYLARASEAGRDRFEAHLDALADAGFDLVRAPALEGIGEVEERHGTVFAAEAALAHHEWFETYGERYAPVTADLIREGRETTVEALADARAGRGRLRDRVESLMDDRGIDAWVAPAAPGPAPEGIESTGDPAMNAPWTYAGMPAASVPAGEVGGLPIGLQCVAAAGDDERLLSWAEPIREALAAGGG